MQSVKKKKKKRKPTRTHPHTHQQKEFDKAYFYNQMPDLQREINIFQICLRCDKIETFKHITIYTWIL